MRNKGLTTAIAILFFGIFLGMKALDYHPLSHEEDSDTVKCELCLFSHFNETLAFDRLSFTSYIPVCWDIPYPPSFNSFQILVGEEDNASFLFGRPPPSVI